MKYKTAAACAFAALAPFALSIPAGAVSPSARVTKTLEGKPVTQTVCTWHNLFQAAKLWPKYRACPDTSLEEVARTYYSNKFSSSMMEILYSVGSGKGFHTHGAPKSERTLSYSFQLSFGYGKSNEATVCGWHNFFQSRMREPLYVQCRDPANPKKILTHKASYGMHSEPDYLKNPDNTNEAAREKTSRPAPNILAYLQGDKGAVVETRYIYGAGYDRTKCQWHNFFNSFNPFPYYVKCKGDQDLSVSIGKYKGGNNLRGLAVRANYSGDMTNGFEGNINFWLGEKRISTRACALHNLIESNMRWPSYVACGGIPLETLKARYPEPDRRTRFFNNYNN